MKAIALVLSFLFCFALEAHADPVTNYVGKMTTVNASIANAGTSSAAVDLGGFTLVGIHFPAAFTGTTVTFTASPTLTGTYQAVYNASGAISYTIAQGRYYAIDPKDFQGLRYLKVVSGSSEGGARTLVLAVKGLN